MISRQAVTTWVLISMAIELCGCGKFLANLRREIDDSDPISHDMDAPPPDPTVGGSWLGRGYMEDGESAPSPAKGRSLASDSGSQAPEQGRTWISPERAGANERDYYRSSAAAYGEPVSSRTQSSLDPERKRQYQRSRVTKDDFVDFSQEEGSLWASSGQTNYYFTKNKVRSPGDLVTLVVEQDLYRDIGLEVRRTLAPMERMKELDVVQTQFRNKFLSELEGAPKDKVSTTAAAPERNPAANSTSPAPASEAKAEETPPTNMSGKVLMLNGEPMTPEQIEKMVPRASLNDVNIYPSIEMKAGETMMGEIIERFPNGNFKIRTVKSIPYKKGPPRLVSVIGIVKATDISEDTDTINSGKLYEYRVEVAH